MLDYEGAEIGRAARVSGRAQPCWHTLATFLTEAAKKHCPNGTIFLSLSNGRRCEQRDRAGGYATSTDFAPAQSNSWMESQNRLIQAIPPAKRAAIYRAKRFAINVFLLFHLLAITCWAIPLDSPFLAAFRKTIRPYFLWSGLFQSWNAFAPAPKALNSYVEAVVIYKDGRILNWKFPRMEHMSLAERYFKERYRKFVENLKEDSNVALWPDAARYVARLNNDPSDPPEIIMLIRHWSDIVLPGNRSSAPQPQHVQIFYEYKVRSQDLK